MGFFQYIKSEASILFRQCLIIIALVVVFGFLAWAMFWAGKENGRVILGAAINFAVILAGVLAIFLIIEYAGYRRIIRIEKRRKNCD